MEIIGANQGSSVAFIIPKSQQVTLTATGLSGDDTVVVEIVELSRAPDFSHNPCCNLPDHNIQVVAATVLKCPDGSPVSMNVSYPWLVLDAPQLATLRARVISADPGATITVNLEYTESDGCTACACRGTCIDSEWTATGDTRCVNGNVEAKESSNCGNIRWTVQGPLTWAPTGETRCRNGNVEAQEASDCGALRWTVQGPVTWTATGEARCRNNLQELQEADDCGNQRWVATTTPCDFCASIRLFCDCTPGFGYHEADIRDPAATVLIADCDGALDPAYIYPTAGPGHTVKITDCDGTLIGYAVNRSDCAPEACTEMKPVFKIVNNVAAPTVNVAPAAVTVAAPTVNVAPAEVAINEAAPNVVAASFDQTGQLTLTDSAGGVLKAQIPTCS